VAFVESHNAAARAAMRERQKVLMALHGLEVPSTLHRAFLSTNCIEIVIRKMTGGDKGGQALARAGGHGVALDGYWWRSVLRFLIVGVDWQGPPSLSRGGGERLYLVPESPVGDGGSTRAALSAPRSEWPEKLLEALPGGQVLTIRRTSQG